MTYAIVTGSSKGLGESIATLFLEAGVNVIGISRNDNEQLIKCAKENNVIYTHYSCDLSQNNEITNTLKEIKEALTTFEVSNLYLVNNAAVIDPINQAMQIEPEELTHHYQVNVLAPMIMMNHLLNEAIVQEIAFVGATITSGAAERPIYGWSAYCSGKASINMYTKTVALEQEEQETGNKVIAFSPGIMDTEMQEKIRSSDVKEFAEVDTFKQYKQNDQLKDTTMVAGVLVDILRDESTIENGKIYRVTDYLTT